MTFDIKLQTMKKTLTRYICGLLTVLAAVACSHTPPDHTALFQELRSADKMIFARMSITKTVKMDSEAWYKIGKRIAVYAYDAHMRAFIDLSALTAGDFVFDEKNHTVDITLPPVQTEVTGRDMELRKVYENIGLLRSEFDSRERALMKEEANRSFREEVAGNPRFRDQLTSEAESKARRYFEELLRQEGYTATISFRK